MTVLVVEQILERLLLLHPQLIDLSLERVRRLLNALGDPQDALPPVIHVAGTNGKGSTIAFLRAMLEASDYRVHVYTQPHLIRFNERIRLAGRLIEDELLIALLEECERVNGGAAITHFEITTAAAFLAFARVPADIVLLETGLGGRFDATNVIARPGATVITPISLDHQHFLGDTVAAIAGEKAGIFKPSCPAVLAPQSAEAAAVLEARAEALGAPLFRNGAEWRVAPDAGGLRYEGRRWPELALPPPGLLGRHQYDNAGAALAALDRVDAFALPAAALAQGLRSVDWPARLQRLTRGPLAERLPPDWELWLDGAHNQGGGAVLAAVAEGWREMPLHLIFGMRRNHDPRALLLPLAPFVASLTAVAIPGEAHALTAEEIALAATEVGISAVVQESLAAAVEGATAAIAGPARILICGSLYLAGRVLQENG
ncbi:MAG TPA: folylpolyglutamate synthase/dihydrofolate synthase family protein [Stellaceae bacterium]|nr:folylpolyglutamate synthase/dihydrofolate synthase family protein [Stellaceae bacterium]